MLPTAEELTLALVIIEFFKVIYADDFDMGLSPLVIAAYIGPYLLACTLATGK